MTASFEGRRSELPTNSGQTTTRTIFTSAYFRSCDCNGAQAVLRRAGLCVLSATGFVFLVLEQP